jgi:hypothetical protein
MAAGDDMDAWTNSGAEAFMSQLIDVVTQLKFGDDAAPQDTAEQAPPVARLSDVGPTTEHVEPMAEPEVARIVPRRVRPAVKGQRERPMAAASALS